MRLDCLYNTLTPSHHTYIHHHTSVAALRGLPPLLFCSGENHPSPGAGANGSTGLLLTFSSAALAPSDLSGVTVIDIFFPPPNAADIFAMFPAFLKHAARFVLTNDVAVEATPTTADVTAAAAVA